MELNFKQYCELEEVKPDYFTKLQDELGIDVDDMQKTPGWSANSSLDGKYFYNGTAFNYKYVKDKNDQIIGAIVKPIETQRVYLKDPDGKMVRVNKNTINNKEFFVKKDDLVKILNQGIGDIAPVKM